MQRMFAMHIPAFLTALFSACDSLSIFGKFALGIAYVSLFFSTGLLFGFSGHLPNFLYFSPCFSSPLICSHAN